MKILYLPNSRSQQRQFQKTNVHIYPVLMAMEAEWYRKQGHEVGWWKTNGEDVSNTTLWKISDKIITEPEGLPFLSLPHPDRVFTRAKEYTSGNYKYLPGTHIMSASGCWHGKCSFCVEKGKPYEVRPVDDVILEIEECKALGFKEVFDDSATFPTGEWLERFLRALRSNIDVSVRFGCNCRVATYPFMEMRSVGFRMLLFGIESANQKTLDKISKGVNANDIIPTIKRASEAGLEPHICVVFGWEWETDDEAYNTLRLVHFLLKKGFAKTAQASFIHQQGITGNESQRHFIRNIYGVWKSPQFWFNQIKDIRNADDLKYLWRKIKAGLNG